MEVICDWKNCKKPGIHKAPVEKNNSKKFRWLCLEHIKEFNKEWDYFEGMSEQEIAEFMKSDLTWHKPTQNFSAPDNFFNILWGSILENKEKDFLNYNKKKNSIKKIQFSNQDIKAFEIMGLEIGAKWEKIYAKFKTLVKKFHPDMNSGNKKFEEKLKIITLAYTQLKITYKESNKCKI